MPFSFPSGARPAVCYAPQCERAIQEFHHLGHLSAGELLRAHIKSGAPGTQELHRIINEGRIVPSEVTVGLLQQAMRSGGK